jgi:phospholipid/cholesterol/gamma-HCH transport system ATP-binding protein
MKSITQMSSEVSETRDPSNEPVIEVQDLHIAFGGHKVLRGMNLELRKGENLVVMGKSGSGKSVLIKCLVRLLEPDRGRLSIFGKNVEDLKSRELNSVRKKIGFLFQSAALYDSMTVRENLEFPLRDSDLSGKEVNSRVKEVLKNVGLLDAIDKMPSELSGGMRKRIGLARTLILNPEIIFYDEPTTGLDPVTSREISELIVEVQKKYDTSGIIITHDLECARITANRVIMIREGKSYIEATYKELQRSEDKWIRSFFE